MDTNLLTAIPDHVVKALCSTLLHSLWLGLLLAAVAGLVVICTRRSSALFRYNLLIAVLGVFTVAVLFTFVQSLSTAPKGLPVNAEVQIVPNTPPAASPLVSGSSNYLNTASVFLNVHAGSVVLIWLLIVMARTLQLLTGLQSLYFLRRRHVSAVSGEWEHRVKELALQLGIKRLVRVAESGIAKVPIVIGHLKPLILIPAGLITALPPEGIEAILVHELAHIRRRDYLINLFISVLEIVFFFNPAVLWIASLIREERENCCDDIAVANTGNKVDYIKALVSCREYQPETPAYAMAFSGRKDHLLGRVKRMLSNNNPSLNTLERAILGGGLLIAVLFTTAFSTAHKLNKHEVIKPRQTRVSLTTPHSDTTRKKESVRINTALNSLKAMRVAAAKDSAMRPDTNKLRIYQPNEVGDHTNVTLNNTDNGMQTRLIKTFGTLYQLNTKAGRIVSLQLNGITVAPGQYQPYLLLMDHVSQTSGPLAALAQKAGALTPLQPKASPIAPLKAKTAALNARLDSLHQNAYKPYTESYKPYHDGTSHDQLAVDLVADGIIQSPGDLISFKLSTNEFIVNGKKMPDDIYQKFKRTYVPVPTEGKRGDWSWFYNYETK